MRRGVWEGHHTETRKHDKVGQRHTLAELKRQKSVRSVELDQSHVANTEQRQNEGNHLHFQASQEKASAEIRGEFLRTKSWVKFAGIFGVFPGEKKGNPLKNPRQNPHQNLGASRPKSTLQASGLQRFSLTKKRPRLLRADAVLTKNPIKTFLRPSTKGGFL